MLILNGDCEGTSSAPHTMSTNITIIDNVCFTNDVRKETSISNRLSNRNTCNTNISDKYSPKASPLYENISNFPIRDENSKSKFYIPNVNTCERTSTNSLSRRNSDLLNGVQSNSEPVSIGGDQLESFTTAVRRECSALGRDSSTLWRQSALLWGDSIVDGYRNSLTGTSDNASTTEGEDDSRTWDTNTTTEEEEMPSETDFKRMSLDANVRRVVVRDGSPIISCVTMDVGDTEEEDSVYTDVEKDEVMDTSTFLEKTNQIETSILDYLCSPTSVIRENGTRETVTIDLEFWVSFVSFNLPV